MTKMETQKLISLEILKKLYEIKWTKTSVKTNNQLKKILTQQSQLRLLMNEIEIHGDKNYCKKQSYKIFLKLISKPLKQIALN